MLQMATMPMVNLVRRISSQFGLHEWFEKAAGMSGSRYHFLLNSITYSKGDDQFPANAPRLIERGDLQRFVDERYAGWDAGIGREILDGKKSLADLEAWARERNLDPAPASGRQELLENLVRRIRAAR